MVSLLCGKEDYRPQDVLSISQSQYTQSAGSGSYLAVQAECACPFVFEMTTTYSVSHLVFLFLSHTYNYFTVKKSDFKFLMLVFFAVP